MNLQKRLVQRHFSRAAANYEALATLQDQVGQEMLARLPLLKIDPQYLLDLGAGTGLQSRRLNRYFPRARVIALDLALPMLQEARRRKSWRQRQWFLQGDAEALPVRGAMLQMIFSNLLLQWLPDPLPALREMRRVLQPEGLLLCSSLGPDSLRELRQAFAEVDGEAHVHDFLDMHLLGDALVQAGFADPVLDVEHYELQYDDLDALLRDLRGIGAASAHARPGLFTPRKLQRLRAAYEAFRTPTGKLPLHYEVVHAHAWAAALRSDGELQPLHFLPRQSRP
ncbi:malonyl-ACP O-methyltransferase BioC [Candidatus Igneacidithiobacillus taiwanensis]|uniref:malonyl-ACP O-methyltransferase BioC n=1 Tax=Candidatus Igneacidithiobacillus taiwanensis TaxID=1945924 RepID=UPI0028A1898C|nr:malonyl-ACP O-methyltransferase BioC [Candidatus Igneacidithiobacillus taiwanensis]MCE5359630.1 malonyl-ACP O-methyltransferase BioC [Acidithiobacillus sp.]